ncbi:MAG TPA: DNA mismatch repair endonuclease MutL [Candidatus Binatia bacterium]|nr:DNA mismatch repair endonuclease MutL [Candidatus Binatia bacterium]
MNRIRLLPEHVANQIAAGEVVERPASVVKELVENSLDAQARHITVDVQAGGRSVIRVTDDGTGMSRDDALLCLERHATSKIQKAEDLSAISTMGFRGEAIPSIASVCRMVLTTRERDVDNPAATQIIMNGGKLVEVRAAGSPSGTNVEVRQLFFNLPARRKFLRSEETEYAHIHHYLTLAALAHPDVGFTFSKDGRVVWQLPPVTQTGIAAVRERMRALFANESELLAVDFASTIPGDSNGEDEVDSRFRLWGLIGKPGVSRAARDEQFVFVNRRPVENRGINFALAEGYHTALMKGRYPVCCLFLEIDPAAVDVNVHPAKREVKFHRERMVRQLVTQAIRQILLAFHTTSTRAAEPPQKPAEPPKPVEFPQFTPLTGTALDSAPTQKPTPVAAPAQPPPIEIPKPVARPQPPEPEPPQKVVVSAPTSAAVPLLAVPLRIVGVIGRLYVVLESDRGLVLMDQHAAHERILFEQMLNRLEKGNAASQRLLLPETIEVAARDAHLLRELLPTLNRLGVGLSEFGERTFLLDALPPFVKVTDARRFALGLIDELKATGQEVNALRLGEHTVAKTVCRHAVKANDPLSAPELENLVKDLRHCAMPYTCPHGRPTLIEINYRELEKKFGRLTG